MSDDKQQEAEMEEREELKGCGCFSWRPVWLQRFNSVRWLLFVLSFSGFMRLMIEDGFTNSVITSIERRFQLRSQDVGTIISIYEITTIIFMLPVSYLGGHGNKPRWISAGIFCTGVASLLFALPHFTTDSYAYFTNSIGDETTCAGYSNSTSHSDSCADNDGGVSSLRKYVYVFGAAKVLSGLGAAPSESLSVVFLDESLTSKQNGIYLSIYFTMGAFGTAVGYLITGSLLGIYTDIYIPEGVNASPSDPGWVGAWWIAFVIGGFVIILVSIPIAMFPRELPKTARVRAEKEVESHKNSGASRNLGPQEPRPDSWDLGREIRGIFKILKHLAINPTYFFTACASIPDILLINSYAAFLPKLLENQFMVTSSIATIVTGVAIIPGAVSGLFLGGWLMRRLKLKIRGLLKLVLISTILKTLLFFIILIHCPQGEFAGITAPYSPSNISSEWYSLSSPCNEDCGCSSDQFRPVCSQQANDLGYFSPCHAGCKQDYGNGSYGDCACLPDESDVAATPATVFEGKCSGQCNLLPVFVILMNILLFVMFMSGVPYVNVILRSVAEHERPVAVGLTSVAVRVLGSIPGPILFGKIIDKSCLQWQETCGVQGACWLYDSASLAWRLATLAVTCNITTVVCSSIALKLYKPMVVVTSVDSKDTLEGALPLTNLASGGKSEEDSCGGDTETESALLKDDATTV